jgi:hypothetical protein
VLQVLPVTESIPVDRYNRRSAGELPECASR